MLRRLLNIASVVCLVLCVALMGMWVRSYYWIDEFVSNPLGASTVGGGSGIGRIAICRVSARAAGPELSLPRFTHRSAAVLGSGRW
jgi:hypothetical protein